MTTSAPSVFDAISLDEYRYPLPDEKIAKHPLAERDRSKLLFYQAGTILHQQFRELPGLLPAASMLVFNNTRVIPARMYFRKETGALIEIFLLQPQAPVTDIQQAMAVTGRCQWDCMIGNRKRWKPEQALLMELSIGGKQVQISARQPDPASSVVEFEWQPAEINFAALVEAAGEIPLPPYLNRKAGPEDTERYQTVYSSQKGAVAAPTAGLHFTPQLLAQLKQQGFRTEQLTLHVGAGTFQPIKENDLSRHPMHREQLVITEENLRHLLEHTGPLISVGTTSMRTLESLYWYGVKLLLKDPQAPFFIGKDECYQFQPAQLPTGRQSLAAVLAKIQQQAEGILRGETEIFIVPGYQFKLCQGLITNFHQPESTLMLLVAAFIGPDWKKVYQQALEQNYRFLSYGDSSLLLPSVLSMQMANS